MRRSDTVFTPENELLEYSNCYRYLGVYMDEHMDFEYSSEKFAESAGRALGSVTYKYKNYPDMGYSTYTKHFDHCVASVMGYASGIWGFRNHTKLDGIQNRGQSVFLGVRRYSIVLCLEGDTGWMKAKNRRHLNMLRYWNRLVKLHFDRLPKRIFVWEYMNGKNNWCSELKDIFSRMDLQFLFENFKICNIDLVKRQLFDVEETE